MATRCSPAPADNIEELGWGARNRTWEWRNQNPLPYRLATPQCCLAGPLGTGGGTYWLHRGPATGRPNQGVELALLGAAKPEMPASGNRLGTAKRRLLCGARRAYALGHAIAMEKSER